MHRDGEECPRKPKKVYRKEESDKLRSKYAWTQKSEQIRKEAGYLCEYCKLQGKYTYDNLEVHHITKLRQNEDGLLDNLNLICLCKMHHKQADAGLIPADELRELAKKREEQ